MGVVLMKNGRGPKIFPRAQRAVMHNAPPQPATTSAAYATSDVHVRRKKSPSVFEKLPATSNRYKKEGLSACNLLVK